jgi:hypothetical protein
MKMKTSKFVALCFGIVMIPVVMATGILIAFGQNVNVSPATPTIGTSPNPNLQYVPQKAYIVTTPDGQVQAVPVQGDDGGATGAAQASGIVGIITAIGMGLYAKITASKDSKNTNAAVLNTKEVTKELARVMFNFQPQQSEALKDAPAIKLETLENDKKQFQEKVAKQ